GQQGQSGGNTAPHQHLGARQPRSARARCGRSGRSRRGGHRSLEIPRRERMSERPADVDLLSNEETARILDLARACKAAARAVLLYPPSHPAIAATVGRIVQTTSLESMRGPIRIEVLPEELCIEGRRPAREDQAVTDLAVLLHDHLIGEMVIQPGGERDAWLAFLQLLGRSPESIRAEGGIG